MYQKTLKTPLPIKALKRKTTKNSGPHKSFKIKNTNEPNFFSKTNHQYNFYLLFSPFRVCANSEKKYFIGIKRNFWEKVWEEQFLIYQLPTIPHEENPYIRNQEI